jgi:ABC-2 type transport system permease protein
VTTARIGERGYQRYTGPRSGHGHAVRSLYVQTLRRVLGLRRPARTKILPVFAIVIAFVPATVFIGIIALFGSRVSLVLPDYPQYYGFITAAVLLFVTFVAPEALCPDRRNRTLSIYLASPLTRETYVTGKVAAVATVLSAVTIGPLVLLLLGYMFQNNGPDGPLAVAQTFARIVLSGLIVTLYYTAISLAVASLTDRRAIAAASTLLLLVGSNIIAGVLTIVSDNEHFQLLNLMAVPFGSVEAVFGTNAFEEEGFTIATWTIYSAAFAVIAIGLSVVFLRYRRLQVTR